MQHRREPPLGRAGAEALLGGHPDGPPVRLDPATGQHDHFFTRPESIGGFTFQEDGSLLLFEENKISRLAKDGSRTVLVENIDDDMERFNDVFADPEGRVYAGTIGKDDECGALYLVDLDGKVTIDYDRSTGELSGRTEWFEASPDEGIPDGLTVDTEGNISTARWDGWAVRKLSPDGELLAKIDMPVAKVTSAAFGGRHLDTLFITSGGGNLDADTADGTLYKADVGARGRPEYRSRVLLD